MLTFPNYIEPRYQINGDKGVIIGRTDRMVELFQYMNHLANLPTTVLLQGETGTGKELFAKALHYNGTTKRSSKPFVAVNCAGIPQDLLESELFGYMKGAFTGAYRETAGKFQHANGGTIFLDEIGDMSLHMQAKILRALQERQVTRIGNHNPESIDVRVVAATNRNLEEETRKGRFREDLFYRLSVVPMRVPSLNERQDDIPLIAAYFIEAFNQKYQAKITGISEIAIEKLMMREWKGNIRELENVIERSFVIRSDGEIVVEELCLNGQLPRKIPQVKEEHEDE